MPTRNEKNEIFKAALGEATARHHEMDSVLVVMQREQGSGDDAENTIVEVIGGGNTFDRFNAAHTILSQVQDDMRNGDLKAPEREAIMLAAIIEGLGRLIGIDPRNTKVLMNGHPERPN